MLQTTNHQTNLHYCSRFVMVATLLVGMHSTAGAVDVGQFQGRWYEIARTPNLFQRDCKKTTATYTLLSNGKLSVVNECVDRRGGCKRISGTARILDAPCNTELAVTFDVPFGNRAARRGRPNYKIFYISPDYNFAIVGTPARRLLWVLSRQPVVSSAVYQNLLAKARSYGFDTTRLITMQ